MCGAFRYSYQGPTGIAGADGTTGPTGPQGPAGANGTSVQIQGSATTSSNLPASGNNTGDGYLTEDDGHLWVWGGTDWTDVGEIQGPAGATGPLGPVGVQGPTGPQGPAGQDGVEPEPSWRLGGNSGTNNWLGTDDNTDLVMKANNQPQLRLGADGVSEIYSELKLSGTPDLTPSHLEGARLLIQGADDAVYKVVPWLTETAYFPIQPIPCRTLGNGDIIPYWDNGVGKIFTVCEPVKVGIGTQTPLSKLDIRGLTYSNEISINTYDTPARFTVRGGGTQAAMEIRTSDDTPVLRTLADGKTIVGAPLQQANDFGAVYLGSENYYVRGGHTGGLRLGAYGSPDALVIHENNGHVGIGTENPTDMLVVQNNNDHPHTIVAAVPNSSSNAYEVTVNGNKNFLVQGDGFIWGRELNVQVGPIPDYVFRSDYDLISLEGLERYVSLNHHLPEIPASKEVEENGMSVGEMITLLLKKVEELMLYLIEQDKKLRALEIELNELKK